MQNKDDDRLQVFDNYKVPQKVAQFPAEYFRARLTDCKKSTATESQIIREHKCVINVSKQVAFNEVDRITRCRDMAIRVYWGIWNPHFGGRGGRRGSPMTPLERAMVISYRLSIVTVALSVTIRPQFAIECLRRSNQQGGGSLCAQI